MTTHYSDTLDQQEAAEYKAQAVSAKFKQQVAYGVGAALVFGLVSALAKTLLDVAIAAPVATAATVAWPVIGLVALGVAGVGLLYLSAKFLSDNIVLDQHLQAKQISSATRAHVQAVEQGVAPKVQEFPVVSELKVETPLVNTLPSTVIAGERELADTITPRVTAKATDATANWAAHVEANDHANQLARAV